MVELQESSRVTPPPIVRHERAPPAVTRDDLAPGLASHVRVLSGTGHAGPGRSALPPLLLLGDEQIDRSLEECLERAGGVPVTAEVTRELELVSQCAARGELHEEALPRQRLDACPRSRP
jgi:hypothetical protein